VENPTPMAPGTYAGCCFLMQPVWITHGQLVLNLRLREMKKTLFLLLIALGINTLHAQAHDPVNLMLAFQKQFATSSRFSGLVRWQRQNGETFTGRFVVEGEKYQIKWLDNEVRCDGVYEWEILHRSKRIKKHFYDPLLAPGVVNVWRFVHLDLMAEVVRIGGSGDKIALDIDFGSSVAQGSHQLTIDTKTLMPLKLILQMDQEGFYERAEFAEVKAGEGAVEGEYGVDFTEWKAQGYSLTDMAQGESDAVWPEERALVRNEKLEARSEK
jgi:hypothetical protein